jgi:hypothetical protein
MPSVKGVGEPCAGEPHARSRRGDAGNGAACHRASVLPNQPHGVKAWETALISMTKQEMLHLALSTNILTAGFAATRHAQPLTVGDSGLVGVPQERRTVPQST